MHGRGRTGGDDRRVQRGRQGSVRLDLQNRPGGGLPHRENVGLCVRRKRGEPVCKRPGRVFSTRPREAHERLVVITVN